MRKFLKYVRSALGGDSGKLRYRFWERYSLDELNNSEWEALCDGCGLCCLLKFEESGSDDVKWTNVACRLLDLEQCRCRHYEARTKIVTDCIVLTPDSIDEVIDWMPDTCAYRLRRDGHPLHEWHYLVSGSTETVHETGISVKGRAVAETEINMDDLEHHVVDKS